MTQTDVSALCWALAALGAQLPGDLMQQLFQTYMTPHILHQVRPEVVEVTHLSPTPQAELQVKMPQLLLAEVNHCITAVAGGVASSKTSMGAGNRWVPPFQLLAVTTN